MRRGTTPTIKIKLKGCDINNLEKIYVTFKQGKYEFEKSMDQLNTSDETLFIKLSQDETLQLDASSNMHSDGHYLRSITSNQGKKVQFKLWNQWSNQKGRYVDFSCAPGSGRLNHKIEPHRIHPGRCKNISSGTDSRNDGVFRITIYSV